MQDMSDTEKMIMKLLWEQEVPTSFSDIMSQLERLDKEWRPTTVRTFLSRLIDKGYLSSERKGQTVMYRPLISEREYLNSQTRNFINTMFNGKLGGLLASLSGQDPLDKETIENLEDFWNKGKGDMK